MSSHRFPGKVLYRVAGKPVLGYLLERLKHCRSVDDIVVATSTDDSDAPVAAFCQELGVACYRGPLLDVAGRFKEVLDVYHFDAFVRVNGDSPLIDPRLIDTGVDIFLQGDWEVVTNVVPRTYPIGQMVWILRSDAFRRGYQLMREDEDFEHVTTFFPKNEQDFRIRTFASEEYFGDILLSVDTPQDMETFAAIVAKMGKPHWQYELQEIIRLYQEVSHHRSENARERHTGMKRPCAL